MMLFFLRHDVHNRVQLFCRSPANEDKHESASLSLTNYQASIVFHEELQLLRAITRQPEGFSRFVGARWLLIQFSSPCCINRRESQQQRTISRSSPSKAESVKFLPAAGDGKDCDGIGELDSWRHQVVDSSFKKRGKKKLLDSRDLMELL